MLHLSIKAHVGLNLKLREKILEISGVFLCINFVYDFYYLNGYKLLKHTLINYKLTMYITKQKPVRNYY